MKLWYSTTSPYVRKVLVTMKHHHLESRIELLKIASSFDPNSPHNQHNPLGRVPALQLDKGEWLFGSLLICEYLDSLGNQDSLFAEGEARWRVLNLHSLADGIMENTTPMIAEKMLRAENEWWAARHQQLMERNYRSFKQLEEKLTGFGNELNIGTLTSVAVIDWWQFRQDKLGVDFAKDFPNLTAWAAEMNALYTILMETKPKA